MASTSGPAHRVQSAVVEYGFPQGHLGHLNESEHKALVEFKALVIEMGLYKPQSETHEFGTHDDAMLLRFLRARRFNVQDALGQFSDTEKWRDANQIDVLYETIELKDYDETRRLYPQWTGRRDKRGIPVYVFEVKHLNSKTMAAYEKSAIKTQTKAKTDGTIPPKLLRLFALYENLIRFVLPLSTAMTDRDHPKTPITQSNNIVDISGVGLKQFWNLRSHMQDASTLATAHYPETLDRIFVIGAPSFFPTVWGWIKRWFDPITTSKIFILSSQDMQSTLRQFIEPENIPKKYGGELQFEFGDMPNLDPALAETIQWEGTHKDFPHGPMFWVDRGDKIELKAVGFVDGKQRSEDICFLPKKAQTHTLEELSPTAEAAGKKEIAQEERDTAVVRESRPDLLSVPTAKEGIPQLSSDADDDVEPTEPTAEEIKAADSHVIQSGELIPASRPEPVSFVTAHDGLKDLTLDGNKTNGENGAAIPTIVNGGPHSTVTANALDPALNQSGPTEDAHEHHEAKASELDKPIGAGGEAADKSHGKTHMSLKDKIKAKVAH